MGLFMLLFVVAKITLECVSMKNTFSQLLFPFQVTHPATPLTQQLYTMADTHPKPTLEGT